MGFARDVLGHYTITSPMAEHEVLAAAEEILLRRLERQGAISQPSDAAQFLRMRLGALAHEEFHIVWLDNRHRILSAERLFTGTIDGASVYPREVVRAALRLNAAACVLSHNHPSGNAEPSSADRSITATLKSALAVIEVRVLDHIIVSAGETVSFAERGLL